MRNASIPVDKNSLLFKVFFKTCQTNIWLKAVEADYPYHLERYNDIEMLQKFFDHGNWSVRSAVQYKDLIFVNQVNGGDEWWTIKVVSDTELVPFESVTMCAIIKAGEFSSYIEKMHKASVDACKSLKYLE